MNRIIVKNLFLLFSVLSGLLFFWNILISLALLKPKMELPLYDVCKVLEKNNKVFVGLAFYNRVQVYDHFGNYLYSVNTNKTHANCFDFEINGDGSIYFLNLPHYVAEELASITSEVEKYGVNHCPFVLYEDTLKGKRELVRQKWYMSFIGGPVYSVVLLMLWAGSYHWISGNATTGTAVVPNKTLK